MDAGTVGEIFLAPALSLTELPNIEAEARANIHARAVSGVQIVEFQHASVWLRRKFSVTGWNWEF